MAVPKVYANWEGGLKEGKGQMSFTGYDGSFTYRTRFEGADGTNPEEMIGAAYAGCYSMALAAGLEAAGHVAESINTAANVTLGKLDGKPRITRIRLTTQARVPGLSEEEFLKFAEETKRDCPVGNALTAVPDVSLEASLLS